MNRTVTIVLKDVEGDTDSVEVSVDIDPPILTDDDEGGPVCWAAFSMLKHLDAVDDEDEDEEEAPDLSMDEIRSIRERYRN